VSARVRSFSSATSTTGFDSGVSEVVKGGFAAFLAPRGSIPSSCSPLTFASGAPGDEVEEVKEAAGATES